MTVARGTWIRAGLECDGWSVRRRPASSAADKAALDALVSDHLSYGHSGGTVQNKAEFVGVIAGKKTVWVKDGGNWKLLARQAFMV